MFFLEEWRLLLGFGKSLWRLNKNIAQFPFKKLYFFLISGLRSQQYKEKLRDLGLFTLEQRHQLDMTQTFKIFTRVDNVNKSTWFTPASEGQVRATRISLECQAAGL